MMMDARAGCLLMLLATFLGASAFTTSPTLETNMENLKSDGPDGDIRRCQKQMNKSNLTVKKFEVLPGIGWDNLRNLEAGLVLSFNYSLCKQTDDGRYFIPDNVFTVPLKFSSLETFAELYDHWLNTSSTTSKTINVQAGVNLRLASISGKFSNENEQLKSKQIEDKAMTTRVEARYYKYEVKVQKPFQLNPQFKSRLMTIAENVQHRRFEQARLEGQLLVRDFGTHVLTSVTAGAGLVKDDYLKREYVLSQSEKKNSILATASVSFFHYFQFSAGYGQEIDEKFAESYERSRTESSFKSYGSSINQVVNVTIAEWSNGVDDNLVPMDRSGDPLYFLVTPAQLPELPATTVTQVASIVRQSIELYYEMNIIPGCTKLGSPNFSFSANFDDGSCHSQPTNLTFGGTYQECSVEGRYLNHNPCDELVAVNPKTGGMSCPPSYTAIKVQLGKPTSQTETKQECSTCWWIFGNCCNDVPYHSSAVYSTYWCAATGQVEKESGYLFGGLYTFSHDNLVTGTKGCPPSFNPQRMFKDVDVCISDDYELGKAYSVPFGGFFSCMAGNPLAAEGVHPEGLNQGNESTPSSLGVFTEVQSGPGTYPPKCPEGYSQHLATNDLNCSIYYCMQTGALSKPIVPSIKRPPFISAPAIIREKQDELVFNNATPQLKNENAQMSPGVSAAITVSVTLVCVAICATIIMTVQRRRARKQRDCLLLIDEQ